MSQPAGLDRPRASEEYADINPDIRRLIGEFDFDLDELRKRYAIERNKRLRKDGISQYMQVTSGSAHYIDDSHVEELIERTPLNDEVEILIIGGGWGGVLAGVELRKQGKRGIRFIDKAGDFGGVWYWNRYPGAQCDTESYIYLQLLEDTGYLPKDKYSYGDEIYNYIKQVCKKYELYEDACFQTQVTGAKWLPQVGRWVVTTDRGDEIRAQYLVVTSGLLDRPKLPGIPGIGEFKGHAFHTSRWDYAYTGGGNHGRLDGLRDKRVGIVGTGATAVQAVPHLGRWSKELYVFQRTPAAVGIRANEAFPADWVASQEPGWQRELLDFFVRLSMGEDLQSPLFATGFALLGKLSDPAAKWVESKLGRPLTGLEGKYVAEVMDGIEMEAIRRRVAKTVLNPETAAALMPWYRRLCKRPVFHDEYLKTFNLKNVRLVDTNGRGIEKLTASAAVVNGESYELDCLIFASGFETGTSLVHRVGYEIIGENGRSLDEHWRDGMRTLHGMFIHGFPNLMIATLGQNGSSVNVTHTLYENAMHIAYVISETQRRNFRSFQPTTEAVDAYVAECVPMSFYASDFWAECTPSYFNNEGDISSRVGIFADQHAGGAKGFFDTIRSWRKDDKLDGLKLT